jgi:hypothetical protein
MKPSSSAVTLLVLGASLPFGSPPGLACCNVIPAADRRFPSTLGEVTTPFARPCDIVTLRRDVDAFAPDPAANEITITFVSGGGVRTTLPPVPALPLVTRWAVLRRPNSPPARAVRRPHAA